MHGPPKIPQDSPFGPLRGAAWRPWPLAPPGPPVFFDFVVFIVFARPPAGSDYPGRPLNERSNDLSRALHGPWPDSQSKQVDRLSIDGVAARSLAASHVHTALTQLYSYLVLSVLLVRTGRPTVMFQGNPELYPSYDTYGDDQPCSLLGKCVPS